MLRARECSKNARAAQVLALALGGEGSGYDGSTTMSITRRHAKEAITLDMLYKQL